MIIENKECRPLCDYLSKGYLINIEVALETVRDIFINPSCYYLYDEGIISEGILKGYEYYLICDIKGIDFADCYIIKM